jgi:hypothetical protein
MKGHELSRGPEKDSQYWKIFYFTAFIVLGSGFVVIGEQLEIPSYQVQTTGTRPGLAHC